MKGNPPLIQVCGDPTVDWLSVRNTEGIEKGGVYFWMSEFSKSEVGLSAQAGGSALLFDLIGRMVKKENGTVEGRKPKPRLLNGPVNRDITNSRTAWKAYMDRDADEPAFRLCEWQGYEHGCWDYAENRLAGKPDLLVIEDSGIAFRDIENGWPESLRDRPKAPGAILLKLAKYSGDARSTELKSRQTGPAGAGYENPLLKRICDWELGRRATVVTALSDLRACAVRIGASLSWETLFEEIVKAVYSEECPFAVRVGEDMALKYARVIVTIGTAGAVIADAGGETLVFDKTGQEEDFSNRYEGEMMGLNTCVMGALAARWASERDGTDWGEAARDGIGLARRLMKIGYEVVEEGPKDVKRRMLRFPFGAIAEAYKLRRDGKAKDRNVWNLGMFRAAQSVRHKTGRDWSILQETVERNIGSRSVSDTLNAVSAYAREIVVKGPLEALKDIPLEIVGNWRSADRQEIEGVRSVNNAMRSYLKEKNASTPLCIAVFGPPGAGKSFAVKEIARQLGIEKDSQLTFNLSQFVSTEEVAAAFHQIRDISLKGRKPLVFWDEFDTPFNGKPLGWLKYFLAPMQDGEFTDRGRVHPVGGGIFVFAGATRHCFDAFCGNVSEEEISAKKPDFISRLKAYIDVKGPNGMPNTVVDRLFIIRRAFLLNFFMESFARNTKSRGGFQIERGALDAYLRVNRYKHGARSMETLVKMSNLNGKRRYELSSLPPDQILDMHANAEDFLSFIDCKHREMMRIGITGHIGLDPDHLGAIREAIGQAIDFIEKKYPDRALTVFSPMALGADRLVARMLLERKGTGLIAVLPVPRQEYVNDFGGTDDHNLKAVGMLAGKGPNGEEITQCRQFKCANAYDDAEMRQEFEYWLDRKAIEVIEMPPAATRNDAYLNAGRFVVKNSDLLFAVWDGLEAQGKGGTGDIVRDAIGDGKPIVHVWAGNYKEDKPKRTEVAEAKIGTFRYRNIRDTKDKWDE
jgi:hypothetical protein